MGAHNLEGHTGLGGQVGEFHPAQQANPVLGKVIGVDNPCVLQNTLQETDTADGLPLDAPGFTVARIVAPVPLGAGLRKVVRHLGVHLVYKMLQLRGNLVVSFF